MNKIVAPSLDIQNLRALFPLLHQNEAGEDLCYLDNAATTLKPQAVIEAITQCYSRYGGPVHRGFYALADEATTQYEQAREITGRFINSADLASTLFTSSATHAMNMVAEGWARHHLSKGDVVYVSRLEHHANFLPWQRVCSEVGAELKIIELTPEGALDLDNTPDLFGARTKMIALCHVSNVTGVQNSVSDLCHQARSLGIATLVDAAQSVAHTKIDVQAMNCDFLAFSAHKMFGPTGIGVLYVHPDRLSEMEPHLVGGGMVEWVGDHFSQTTFMEAPTRFEAGSQNLAGAVGLAAAIEFITDIRLRGADQSVHALAQLARRELSKIDRVKLLPCPHAASSSIVSFTIDGVHPHDIAQTAGEHHVAIRAGHHCAQPLMQHFDIAASARASFSIYNRESEIAVLIHALEEAIRDFG